MPGSDPSAEWAPGYTAPTLLRQGRRARIIRATRVTSGAEVVLKVLPPEAGRAEAAHMQSLDGVPGVVPLLDAGVSSDGAFFVVLPHYPDGSFGEMLAKKGPAPVQEAAAVSRSVAAALGAMHGRGLIHGDVCPGNVLHAGRTPVLTGFGSVHRIGEAPPAPSPAAESFLHSPPEALRGAPRTPASDVYQLASTVWTILVGRAPFAATDSSPFDPHQYANRVLQDEPAPVLRSDISRSLRRVLIRALAKDPEARYATPTEFATAFERARTGRPVAPSSAEGSPSGPQALPATAPSGPQAPPDTVPSDPRVPPSSAPSGPQAPHGTVAAGPQAPPSSVPSGPQASHGAAPSGPQAPPPSTPSGPQETHFPWGGAPAPQPFPGGRTAPEPSPSSPGPHTPPGASPVEPPATTAGHASARPAATGPQAERHRDDPYGTGAPADQDGTWAAPGGSDGGHGWDEAQDSGPEGAFPSPGDPRPDEGAGLRPRKLPSPEGRLRHGAVPENSPNGTADLMMAKLRGEEISPLRAWARLEGWSGEAESSYLPVDDGEKQKEKEDDWEVLDAAPNELPRWRRQMHIAVAVCGTLVVTLVASSFAATNGSGPMLAAAESSEPEEADGAAEEEDSSADAGEPVEPSPPPQVAEPSGVALEDTFNSVTLTWADNSGGTAHYFVLGGLQGQEPQTLARTGPGTVTAQVNTANASAEYCFTVIAVDGAAAPSDEVCTTRAADRAEAERQAQEEREAEEEEEEDEDEEDADPSPSPSASPSD